MASKGKAVTVTGASGVTMAAVRGPRCCHYNGLRERFRIGDEYEIIDAKEGESYLVNKLGCLPLSVDHMEAGLRLLLPEVAKVLLNRWGVSPIQLTPNTWRYICIFGVICRIKQIRGSADVFRAHFKLSASLSSGVDVYYAKHRTDMMHIQLSGKYSNNKGWMDRLFFVRRQDGAEWGFPTAVRSAQKDSFPKLIQDEARASDSLLRAGVRNGEGYLTEFSLVRHAAAEVEAGRDQEANEDFAEQIPVMAHMVYEGDNVTAFVRVPSTVRVGTAVTTALVAPSPAKGRAESTRVPEKGPEKIRLKKKATIKVVSADALRSSFEEGEGASWPSATMKKRPMLLDEGVEAEDQLRARKKKKLVRAAPQQSEEGTEEEADGAQLLLHMKCKAAGTAEQEALRMPLVVCPKVIQRMETELGLVVLSDGSESSTEEQEEVPAPPGPNEGRREEVARTAASSTEGAEQDAAGDATETFAQRGEGHEETPVMGEGTSPRLEVPEENVPEVVAASGAEETTVGGALVEGPLPPSEVIVTAKAQTVTSVPKGTKEVSYAGVGEISETAQTTEGQEMVSEAAGGAGPSEAPAGGTAEEHADSEEDRRPLIEVLRGRLLPPSPTTSYLERVARFQSLSPAVSPEHSSGAYRPERLNECDDADDADVVALVNGVMNSLGVLKKLAMRAQGQRQMWEAETAFCDDLVTKHRTREAEMLREVKSLQDALRASEVNLTVARAEKEAIAKVLAEARAQGVAEYKEGPNFKKDLEQFRARCYKVGLEAEKELEEKLAWIERAREAFEAAGCVEELLVAEELWNDHKKLIFFPFSSVVTCTNRPLEIDQR
ncbi:hypothetical protein Taro_025895 [Colocasia esculenta]|uniref:Transposase (putative) gypsy type domain-containing protein n=1 Tax=Colocasia esculenta TaxID=4460 RepID=A0A843VA22_COLES|nr:hypothetical protein [Colocasia esculenta]